jgi:hypothetical protein
VAGDDSKFEGGSEFHHPSLDGTRLDCWWDPFGFNVEIRDIVLSGGCAVGWYRSFFGVSVVWLLEPVTKMDAMFKTFDGFKGIYFRTFPFQAEFSLRPRRLVRLGVGQRVIQMLWCTMPKRQAV